MPSRIASRIALPYIRRELPAWGKLYHAVVGPRDTKIWSSSPNKVIRGKLHGYRMRLDLSDWSDRAAYFLARYYDLSSQLLYQRLIDQGDAVLDVGANIGMMMLLAASRTGPSGRVDCIEPNPTCADRLKDHIALNNLSQVYIHNCGLADKDAEFVLRVVTDHTGVGTMADIPAEHDRLITASIVVPVRRGDNIVDTLPRPPRLIKIDVEGFELRVVKGLQRTITATHPILLLEFVESHLNRAGTSRDELTALLKSLGYEGFAISLRRKRLSYRLKLNPFDDANTVTVSDTLWVHPNDPRRSRLSDALARS